MPTQTYDLLASTVLTSDTAQVSFTSLDTVASGYRDLVVVFEGISSRTNSSNDDMQIYFNSLSSGSYYGLRVFGASGSYFIQSQSGGSYIELSGIKTISAGNIKKTLATMEILDFSQTNKDKLSIIRRNDYDYVTMQGERWDSTSAITTINFDLTNGNFVTGSTFYLYGIVS